MVRGFWPLRKSQSIPQDLRRSASGGERGRRRAAGRASLEVAGPDKRCGQSVTKVLLPLLLCQEVDGWGCPGPGWRGRRVGARRAGQVAFEAADGFGGGLAFGAFAGEVGAGLGVAAGAGDGDAVDGGVDLAVAAAVETSFGMAPANRRLQQSAPLPLALARIVQCGSRGTSRLGRGSLFRVLLGQPAFGTQLGLAWV